MGEAMTFDEYQRASSRTINTALSQGDQLANAAMGISGEAGEVAGLVKKMLFQEHQLNPIKVARQLQDDFFGTYDFLVQKIKAVT